MQKARRKLIKGALAATVVTTAGCGGSGGGGGGGAVSGLGAGSPSIFSVPSQSQAVMSWQVCVEKSEREAEAAQVQTLTQVDDSFLRGTLPVADGLITTTPTSTQLVEGQFFLDGAGGWRQIVNGGTGSTLTQWTRLTAEPRRVQDMQVLLAIDVRDGSIIQTRLEGPEGNVATDSCWSSLKTGAAKLV
jgi:hypothetical protein